MKETQTLKKAIEWIHNNNVDGNGIVVTDKTRIVYPEVTGYYIPSLLKVGEKELAISFAKYLCSIQKKDGAWYDSTDKTPFIFDSGQILKGLIAIRGILPEVDEHIVKGVEWMLSTQNSEGRFVQQDQSIWVQDDTWCNDLIHIYTFSPIKEAAKIFNKPEWDAAVEKALDYYIATFRDRIVNYTLFSHFYAYVIEGLIDCGRIEIAKEAMANFEKYRRVDGSVWAKSDATWACSTATFQFAIIWYKLGEKAKADKSFDYACSLQNATGGWYGSYKHSPFDVLNVLKTRLQKNHRHGMYERTEEISWAVKFFIDASYYKELSEK